MLKTYVVRYEMFEGSEVVVCVKAISILTADTVQRPEGVISAISVMEVPDYLFEIKGE